MDGVIDQYEEEKGEPVVHEENDGHPMDAQAEFDADMAKINADPKLAKLSFAKKQKIALITASTRMEARMAKARAEEANARRLAKQEKIPLTVEEAAYGPEPSKTMQRKNKQHRAGAVPATVPDLAAMAELGIQFADPAPDVPVKSACAKKLGARARTKMIEKELHLFRLKTWDTRCAEFVERYRRIYATKNPNASQAEVQAHVTLEHAKKYILWEDIEREVTLADIEDRGQLTTKQQNEARKIDARREAEMRAREEERQRKAEEDMSADDRREYELRAAYLARLQTAWQKMTLRDHEDRRATRISMAQQAILQRSIEFFEELAFAFVRGAPLMMQGQQLFVSKGGDGDDGKKVGTTLNEEEAERDEDGNPVLARGPPGEPVYLEFNVRPESFMQFAHEWNPLKEARIVGLSELERKLAYYEKEVDVVRQRDPTDRLGHLEDVIRSEEMFRNLVRSVKTCNRLTHWVMSISVKCDTILDFRGTREDKRTTAWAKEIHGVFTHHRDTQDNLAYIASLGPIKTPLLVCHIDRAFCLAGTAIRYGGKAPPPNERAQLTIKTCSKEECAHVGFHNGPPVFCCQACKLKHILQVHDATAVARKTKANKDKKARKRKARLARLAEAAAAEAALHDPVQEDAVVDAAMKVHEERKQREEEAELAAFLPPPSGAASSGDESEADEEIEV